MNVFPQDLGTRRHVALIADRAAAMNGARRGGHLRSFAAGSAPGGAPRLGLLGRLWTRGTDLEPEDAANALDAMRPQTLGMLGGLIGGSIGFITPAIVMASTGEPVGAALFGALWAAMTTAGLSLPGIVFRRLHGRPLAEGEIEELIPQASDELERAYLTLARDAVRQRVPDAAEGEIRAALRALGEAIDRLPAFAASAAALDVDALRRDAEQARRQSESETDAVIAASRERRAEALERSAASADRSALLMRRAAALREEMIAQTEALRLGLAAFDTGATDVGSLAHLAASVRGVAAEAASVSEARAELDALVTGTNMPPVPLRVGRGA